MQPQIRLEGAMHTQCFMLPASSLLLAQLTLHSSYSVKRHLQLSLTWLFCSFTSSPPFPPPCFPGSQFLSFVPLAIISFASPATSPSRLHSDMAQSHRSVPPCSSSQTACRRPVDSWNRTEPFGTLGQWYCPLWHPRVGLQPAQPLVTNLQ